MKKNEEKSFLNSLNDHDIVLHLSHNDLDGYASTYVVGEYLKNKAGMLIQVNTNYGEIIKSIDDQLTSPNMVVIITDLNLKIEECEYLDSRAARWLIVDHHKTGIDSFEEYPRNYYLDWNYCATKLIFELFNASNFEIGQNLTRLSEVVDTYDLWQKHKGVDFNYGMLLSLYVYNFPFEVRVLNLKYIEWLFDTLFNYLLDNGVAKTELQYPYLFTKWIESIENAAFIKDQNLPMNIKTALMQTNFLAYYTIYENDDVVVFSGISTKVTQYAFDELFNTEHYKNKVLLNFNSEKGTIAFRSRNERASFYAQLCGGGGHPNASGCKLVEKEELTFKEDLLQILKGVYGNAD